MKRKSDKTFKRNGLSITEECYLIVADLLVVTFVLKSDRYYQYREQNNELQI